ncbi:DNA-processing protein DprA [Rossellomorea sp. NS-SX7]|uniref:DNA-processing protein DprA n=1 Tax=Rossellomorea sp. NS-SX7 TaxID=3463856 RepID=UPI004058AC5E
MSTAFWMAISNVEGLGIKTIKKLCVQLPDLTESNIYKYEIKLRSILRNSNVVERVLDLNYLKMKIKNAERSIIKHKEHGIEVIHIGSEDYPALLRLIDDPPPILYCKGNINLLNNHNSIAVIGTRKATEKGYKAAIKIAFQFAKRNYVIVSGLALGIDTAGHLGALKANGHTIAVMAGSLDKIYPKENTDIAHNILENNGLLISEIPLGGQTYRNSFVKRDRIQSGLSLGVCPIQSPIKSGTQHTIKFAQEQRRLLFCPEPQETKDVEATQGIYQLLESGLAEKISNEGDYEEIIKLLNKTYDQLLGEKLNLKQIKDEEKETKVNPSKITTEEGYQISLFDNTSAKKETERQLQSKLDDLINQIIDVSHQLKLTPSDFIDRYERIYKNLRE